MATKKKTPSSKLVPPRTTQSNFNNHGIPNFRDQEMLNAPRKPYKPKNRKSKA